jgi:hypothetical protein
MELALRWMKSAFASGLLSALQRQEEAFLFLALGHQDAPGPSPAALQTCCHPGKEKELLLLHLPPQPLPALAVYLPAVQHL